MSKSKRSVKRREWRALDSAVAAILLANILMLAAVVVWPTGDEPDPKPTATKGDPERDGDGDDPSGPTARRTKAPLLPRHELWQRSQRQAADGRVEDAIDSLQLLLRNEPRMGEVPRRAVWLQLSYLAGIAGREEDATRWLRLSKASLELGLVPDELLRLAREAAEARDWSESRRYAARFLLQQGQVADDVRQQVASAYMILGDSYRDQAGVESVEDTSVSASSANSRGSRDGEKSDAAKGGAGK